MNKLTLLNNVLSLLASGTLKINSFDLSELVDIVHANIDQQIPSGFPK
jgi:hypothetical protein